MTCIAYRDGVLAADSQLTLDGLCHTGTKLYVCENSVVGVCGDYEAALVFVDWYRNRESRRPDLSNEQGFAALALTPHGLEYWTVSLRPHVLAQSYYAIGSGAHVAMGAFDMGANAKRAVEAACRWADGCDGPVLTLTLPRKRASRKG